MRQGAPHPSDLAIERRRPAVSVRDSLGLARRHPAACLRCRLALLVVETLCCLELLGEGAQLLLQYLLSLEGLAQVRLLLTLPRRHQLMRLLQ